MTANPRIPEEIVAWLRSGAYLGDDNRAAPRKSGPPPSSDPELQRLGGVPVQVKDGLEVDPVVAELIRILNAQTQGCVF